jgi:hypothetical protein
MFFRQVESIYSLVKELETMQEGGLDVLRAQLRDHTKAAEEILGDVPAALYPAEVTANGFSRHFSD